VGGWCLWGGGGGGGGLNFVNGGIIEGDDS